jgi:hypothetical protein
MEQIHVLNGTCYRATFDVAHYRKTGEIVYTSPREPYRADLDPAILDMLQNCEIGPKRLTYLLNKGKFLHIAAQSRMNNTRLSLYFGCPVEVITALKKKYEEVDCEYN